MPALSTSPVSNSAFVTPYNAPLPPVPKLPEIYAAPTVSPVLKYNSQSLTTSMSNLRIGSASLIPGSLTNLRAASTFTMPKQTSPKATRVRRQSVIDQSPPTTPTKSKRHSSTIAPATVLQASKNPSPSKPSPSKPRKLHTSRPTNAMLSDNVHLPTFTAEIPIEMPRVPILPEIQRAPPPVEIDTPSFEQPIITAAGAHTHPAPPGRSSLSTKEHLQSDSSRPKKYAREAQVGKFEGDWEQSGAAEEDYKFERDQGDIAKNDKGILWGIVGAATLWGVFGPGKKKHAH
jgi:hypothetical protein